jgi:hypothetical protein
MDDEQSAEALAAADAAAQWRRIANVVRALEGDTWPADRAEDVVFDWTRSGKPFARVEDAAYILEDASRDPSEDRVFEVRSGRTRVIGTAGVVESDKRTGDPSMADWN